MNVVRQDGFEYISYKEGRANIIFFTAYDDADFSMLKDTFPSAMDKVKKIFDLRAVGYGRQIHSDIINIFDESAKEGDALVTERAKTAVGIFTADCVPVLLYDRIRNICAAVHSGWKGTYSRITLKTLQLMEHRFDSRPEDISVYIGPHIRGCCYEVSRDLIELFKADLMYESYPIAKGRLLNLEMCIRAQCISGGINDTNIHSTGLCTYCSDWDKLKFHSYRKQKEKSGRMFSLIYMDE